MAADRRPDEKGQEAAVVAAAERMHEDHHSVAAAVVAGPHAGEQVACAAVPAVAAAAGDADAWGTRLPADWKEWVAFEPSCTPAAGALSADAAETVVDTSAYWM